MGWKLAWIDVLGRRKACKQRSVSGLQQTSAIKVSMLLIHLGQRFLNSLVGTHLQERQGIWGGAATGGRFTFFSFDYVDNISSRKVVVTRPAITAMVCTVGRSQTHRRRWLSESGPPSHRLPHHPRPNMAPHISAKTKTHRSPQNKAGDNSPHGVSQGNNLLVLLPQKSNFNLVAQLIFWPRSVGSHLKLAGTKR